MFNSVSGKSKRKSWCGQNNTSRAKGGWKNLIFFGFYAREKKERTRKTFTVSNSTTITIIITILVRHTSMGISCRVLGQGNKQYIT
jgi:hypothetical protein